MNKFVYHPANGIKYLIEVTKVAKKEEHNSYFVYAKLSVKNNSKQNYLINIGKIKSSVGDLRSQETWYDSLASNLPGDEKLKSGVTNYNIYFVFSDTLDANAIDSFKLTEYGLFTE